ncbi:MAG TPA: cellulose biosynthesis protein BcsS [Rhabdaerophilum sp.]|nr:cellulose biosynthesis protein BcsS [Rhabdaerophilum sp.]
MSAFFEGLPPGGSAAPLFRRNRRDHDIWFNPLPLRNVFFAGYDVSGTDHFASIGLKRALGSTLDVPGFRFLGSLGIKVATRDATTGDRVTRLHAVRASLGHEFHIGNTAVTVYAGTSVVKNPDGAVLAGTPRSRFGPVAMVDLWQNWSDGAFDSRYSSAFVMADQASRSFYIRVRHGFGMKGHPWRIGPEASFSSGATLRSRGVRVQDGWNSKRLGLHVSEIPIGDARLSVSCGGEWRKGGKSALYTQAGLYFRY